MLCYVMSEHIIRKRVYTQRHGMHMNYQCHNIDMACKYNELTEEGFPKGISPEDRPLISLSLSYAEAK
jgi:hypothetical protein